MGEGLLLADVSLSALVTAADPYQFLADAAADAALCLGATADGVTFRCVPNFLHTEQRGLRTPVRGSLLPSGWQVTLSGTLTAVTPRTMARLMNAYATDLSISVGSQVPLSTLLWVGDTTDGLLVIELSNPLSTGGVTFSTQPQGMGCMPFTFTAQQSSWSSTVPPCRVQLIPAAKGGDAS